MGSSRVIYPADSLSHSSEQKAIQRLPHRVVRQGEVIAILSQGIDEGRK